MAASTENETLRFIICGSAEEGKSTVIGRLLHERKKRGAEGERKFVVADTPGHEQTTRDMAIGASTANLAVILVDARKGVLTETRLHSRIVAMMGIRQVVLGINNMDLVNFDQAVFDRIDADYRAFAAGLGLLAIQSIPVSALKDDNVTEPSRNTAWYHGPTLMQHLNEVDLGRGNVPVPADEPAQVADQFEARLLWMSERPLLPGRSYFLKIHNQEVAASVTAIKFREDIDSGSHLAAKTLGRNEIGMVNLSLSEPVVFEPHAVNRELGGFILIDRLSLETVGAGTIVFALRRASNIHWQALTVDRAARAGIKQQTPRCIWLTGLSGSGKSTIANLLENRLHAQGLHTCILDGDNVRHGLNRDLGFTEADRIENIRRVAEVARLMVDAGLIVIVALISPFRADREMARRLFDANEFVEVFVDTSLAECEQRDPKGLYAKARRGELKNFTGIDSPYEPPQTPEMHLRTATAQAAALADQLANWLDQGA